MLKELLEFKEGLRVKALLDGDAVRGFSSDVGLCWLMSSSISIPPYRSRGCLGFRGVVITVKQGLQLVVATFLRRFKKGLLLGYILLPGVPVVLDTGPLASVV